MKILIPFENPTTGKTKDVKLGFSWQLFFLSGIAGIPLFLRKLHIWGAIFLLIWVVNLMIGSNPETAPLQVPIMLFWFILIVIVAFIGNKLTARKLIKN